MKFLMAVTAVLTFLATSAQDPRTSLIERGDNARRSMQFEEAIIFYEQAYDVDKSRKNTVLAVFDLIFIGESYISLNNMDSAVVSFFKALELSEAIDSNYNPKLFALTSISFTFFQFGNMEKAVEYLEQAEALIEKQKSSIHSKRKVYNLRGRIETAKKNYPEAVVAYERALAYTTDTILHDRMLQLNNIVTPCYLMGEKERAMDYLMQAKAINDKHQNPYWSMVIPGRISKYKLDQGAYREALEYSLSALQQAQANHNQLFIMRISQDVAKAYAKLGNYEKAYDYYLDYVAELMESQKNENDEAIAEMEAKYENAKKKQEIEQLQKDKIYADALLEREVNRKKNLIIQGVILFGVLVLISFLIITNQRNKQKLKLQIVEKEHEIATQRSELEGQEQERNRLSKELHDGLGGTLASIKMRLDAQNIEAIRPILNDIDDACLDVRNMSHSLSTALIDEIPFYTLLNKLCADLKQRTSLEVTLDFLPVDALNALTYEVKHQSYRIIQELTNNVVKHAFANQLIIGLMKDEDEVLLLVEDDGIGYDPKTIQTGIGLSNVNKRLESIAGAMEVNSMNHQGTTYTIRFPYITVHENKFVTS